MMYKLKCSIFLLHCDNVDVIIIICSLLAVASCPRKLFSSKFKQYVVIAISDLVLHDTLSGLSLKN